MAGSSQTAITQLLEGVGRGDREAADKLFEQVYRELRKLAREHLRRERADHTLQPTALVHEAYLRLVNAEGASWQSRAHFFNVAAQIMRNILVDHARQHRSRKRGGGMRRLALDEAVSFSAGQNVDLVALDEALEELKRCNERHCRIVELRFFGGLDIREVAAVLGEEDAEAVGREWRKAKMWLQIEGALATAYERAGFLLKREGAFGEAEAYVRRAVALREALRAEDRADPERSRRLAESYVYLGDTATPVSERWEHYRRAFELREEVAHEAPADLQNLRDLAQSLQRLGASADDTPQAHREALANSVRALELREQIAASPQATVQDQRYLADQSMLTADGLLRAGERGRALPLYERARRLFESLAATDPANAEARRDLAFVRLKMGQAALAAGGTAREHFLAALGYARALYESNPNKEDTETVAAAYRGLARFDEARGDLGGAIENARKGAELLQRYISAYPGYTDEPASSYSNLGRLYAKSAGSAAGAGRREALWREARAAYARSAEILLDLLSRAPSDGALSDQLSKVARALARCDAALASLR